MSCHITETDEGVFEISIEDEIIADDIEHDELGEEVAHLLESGDLDPEDVVVFAEWDGSTRRRRAIAFLNRSQRESLGYAIGAQPVAGSVQDDLD